MREKTKYLKIILEIYIFTFVFISSIFAAAISNAPYQPNSYFMKDSLFKSTKEASLSVNAINGLSIDPFTGSTNLNIPLITPQGRTGMQPTLNLNYSNSNPNGPLGVGWRLELGYIERSTKDGFPVYYKDGDKYIFSLNGNVSELVSIGSSTYVPEREPENYRFTFDGRYWKAKDKLGRSYYFGTRDSSASVEQKYSGGGWIFRWYLVKVEDMQGNSMVIEYGAGQGGTPSKIYYSRHSSNPAGLAEIFIEFIFESTARQDYVSTHRPDYYLTNSKRLSQIKVWLKESSGNKLIKKYTFEYKYSALTNRSLLTKVTEFGSDGTTALPPITFAYQENSPAYTVVALTDNSTYFADFNGDGLADMGSFSSSTGTMSVRLSAGNSFGPSSVWISGFGINSELLLGDFNADGRTDICAFYKTKGDYYVAFSDGRKFVNKGQWMNNPYFKFTNYNAFVAEVDGDGLSDIVTYACSSNNFYYSRSTGNSFEYKWSTSRIAQKGKAILGDFEADGLTDICEYDSVSGAWVMDILRNPSVAPNVARRSGFGSVGFGSGKEVFPVDANSDGLTDAGYYNYSTGKVQVRAFNGKGFKATQALPFTFSLRQKDTKIQSGDFNGDGLTDFAVYYGGKIEIAYSQGSPPDLLSRVTNGIGATMDLIYRLSCQYTNKRSDGTPGLPFVTPVFYQSRINDARGNTYTTTYSYLGGLYDDAEREFVGFSYCRVTDNEGNYTEQFFRQDKPLRGKLYKEMVKDASGKLYLETGNLWKTKELYPGVNLVYLEQVDTYTYDGDASFRQTRTSFEYDDYGNPTKISSEGDVSFWGDEKTQVSEYNYNLIDWIVSLPGRTYLLDQNYTIVSEKRFYYDGATAYNLPPLKGLLTKKETWAYNPLTIQADWISTSYAYDEFGNVVEVTNPLGHSSFIEYDAKLKTYPTKITNAQGHTTTSTYDYGTGNILSTTDPNNQTTAYKYDPLGRLINVIGPNDNKSYPGVIYTYNLSSRPTLVITSKRIMPLSGALYTTYSFYDGLGRLIETKTPAESGQVVSDVVKFDAQGRVKEKYLPYFVSASSSYVIPGYSGPKISFTYDCLGRLIQTTNPDGTYNSTTYSDWMNTFWDENSHYKNSYLDAYGRIIKIEEYNNGQIYTTTYEYDALGNLIKITDDQNNIVQMWYDSLSRKIKMDDPDMGVWTYEYDKVDNMVKQTDAKGQILTFTYDALNRIKTEKSGASVLASYTYDDSAKSYCRGRLSQVIDASGSSEYFYDKLGRQIKFIKTVEGTSYTIEQTYDALDRVISLKYPDGEIVKYTYNTAGGIEKVIGSSTYVSNIDYSATAQLTKITYGNSTSTNYTYNPNTLRLTNLITQFSTTRIQDLSYQFDKVGNISRIVDRINTANQDFLYDDLDRLIQASGSYGVFTYGYDSIGNMTYKEGVSYNYGQAGSKPHALTSASDGSQFVYDNNGNLIEESSPLRKRVKYYYDAENNLVRVEPQRQLYSFSINLKPGWNLLSLPIVPLDTNIFQVLTSLQFGSDYNQVARYNANTKTWEMFINEPEFDQFYNIEYGKGYQIYITNPNGVTLIVKGYLSSNETSFPIPKGWNLVGFPFYNSILPVKTALKPLALGVDYDTVERYNTTTKTIEKYTATLKQFSELKQGNSYYLKALKDTTWKVAAQNTGIKEPVELNEFVYDSSGSRVKKITSQGTVIYIGELFEKFPDGSTRKHIFAEDQRICTVTKGLSPTATVPKVYYYHCDHLGSSNVITDKAGKQVQLVEYTPYGSIVKGLFPRGTVPESSLTNYLFTGKELDTTGFYYYGARYYHHQIGRFTQPDPVIQNILDPQSLNHYSYCRNNPLIYVDPTGLSWSTTWDSWGSSITNAWNSLTSSISTGISTIGNWGKQTTKNIWNETKNWGSALGTGINYGLNQIGTGLYNFGSSVWNETKIWGSALGMGMGYGLNTIGNTAMNIYKNQIDTYKWMGQQVSSWWKGNDNIDRWWPKPFERFIPSYGNYGGPLTTDSTFRARPVDSMDALFMEHDWYWSQGKGRQGDIVLLVNLVNLPFNPKRWEQPAPNISKAIRYRELVFMFIGWHAILENE